LGELANRNRSPSQPQQVQQQYANQQYNQYERSQSQYNQYGNQQQYGSQYENHYGNQYQGSPNQYERSHSQYANQQQYENQYQGSPQQYSNQQYNQTQYQQTAYQQSPQTDSNPFDDSFGDWGLPAQTNEVNPFDDPFSEFMAKSDAPSTFDTPTSTNGSPRSNEASTPPPTTQYNDDVFEFDLQPIKPKDTTPARRTTPTTPPSPTSQPRQSPQKKPSMIQQVTTKPTPVKRRFEFRVGIQPNYLFRVGIFDERNELIYKVQMKLEVRTEINDANNKAVALITRESMHIHPTFSISTNRGRIGLCKQRFKLSERKFNYQITSTGQFIKMSGDFGSTFVIKKNEKQVGNVQTKQKGYIVNLDCLASDVFHVLCQVLVMMEQRYLSDGVIVVK
jgi:uncharacterized protein YxjI